MAQVWDKSLYIYNSLNFIKLKLGEKLFFTLAIISVYQLGITVLNFLVTPWNRRGTRNKCNIVLDSILVYNFSRFWDNGNTI